MQLDFFNEAQEHVCTETRVCRTCQEEKLLSEFHVMSRISHKYKEEDTVHYHTTCKTCYNKRCNDLYHLKKSAPPPSSHCDCCGVLLTKPCLDHDHNTLEFRGWLCYSCNTGIGKLGDTIEGLEKGLSYLKRHYDG